MGDHEDENDPTKMPEATAQVWGLVAVKSLVSHHTVVVWAVARRLHLQA